MGSVLVASGCAVSPPDCGYSSNSNVQKAQAVCLAQVATSDQLPDSIAVKTEWIEDRESGNRYWKVTLYAVGFDKLQCHESPKYGATVHIEASSGAILFKQGWRVQCT